MEGGVGGSYTKEHTFLYIQRKRNHPSQVMAQGEKKNYDLCPGNSGKYIDGIIKSKKTNLIPKSGDRVRWRTTTAYAYCHDT